jgi:hypothetical protein
MPTLDIAAPEALSSATLISWLARLPEPAARDRRAHERLMAHELDWLKSARLRFGPRLSLIDLSPGGAQFETSAPLRPGATAALTISGRGVDETASFRVLRCEVTSLGKGAVYRGACVFDRAIQIPGAPSGSGAIADPDDSPAEDDLWGLIRSVAGRGAASATDGRHGQLIAAIRTAVERGYSAASLLRCVERELGVGSQAAAATRTSISLSIAPAPVPPVSEVAAPPSVPAHVVTTAAAPAPAAAAAPATPLPPPLAIGAQPASAAGWNKLVVRYLDGTVLKGFSQDFHPTRLQFHIAPSIVGGRDKVSLVLMRKLKAVFFVRDFAGDPGYVDSRLFSERTAGRRIEVTFTDGELMVGTTLGYRPDGSGFFVRPADSEGNNLRVFVAPGAVKRVRFL